MIEEQRQRRQRVNRTIEARRDIDNILRSTVSSSCREREIKERINLNLPPEMKTGSKKNNKKLHQRRRSLDFGDLYHLHNLPKLSTPEWRTLV